MHSITLNSINELKIRQLKNEPGNKLSSIVAPGGF